MRKDRGAILFRIIKVVINKTMFFLNISYPFAPTLIKMIPVGDPLINPNSQLSRNLYEWIRHNVPLTWNNIGQHRTIIKIAMRNRIFPPLCIHSILEKRIPRGVWSKVLEIRNSLRIGIIRRIFLPILSHAYSTLFKVYTRNCCSKLENTAWKREWN